MSFPRIKVDYTYHAPHHHDREHFYVGWEDQFDEEGELKEPIERPISFEAPVRLCRVACRDEGDIYLLENLSDWNVIL